MKKFVSPNVCLYELKYCSVPWCYISAVSVFGF